MNQQQIAIQQALRILGGTFSRQEKINMLHGLLRLANALLTPMGAFPEDLDDIWRAVFTLPYEEMK